jgi:hypothetical protein
MEVEAVGSESKRSRTAFRKKAEPLRPFLETLSFLRSHSNRMWKKSLTRLWKLASRTAHACTMLVHIRQ